MFVSPDGWQLYTEVMSIRTLYNMQQRGQLDFDWDKQRGFVWKRNLSSRFIHSILWGMLDKTETFRFSKHGNKYFCTDGKQRGTSILNFVNNKYKIVGISEDFPIYLFNGSRYSIRGKFFNQLPQELQDKIWDMQINIAVVENATHDVEAEMFRRLNDGIKVNKTDISLAKNENVNVIDNIGKHKVFTLMFGNAVENKKYRPVIVKIWVSLTESEPDYVSRRLHKLEEEMELSDDDIAMINNTLDALYDICKYVATQSANLRKKMFSQTFLYYFIPYINMFEGDFQLAGKWVSQFLKDIPEEYDNIHGFSNEKRNVAKRMGIIKESISDFLTKY